VQPWGVVEEVAASTEEQNYAMSRSGNRPKWL